MPKSKYSAKAQPSALQEEEAERPSHPEESTSSDHKSDVEVSFHTIHPQAPPQFPSTMYIPYIEGSHGLDCE